MSFNLASLVLAVALAAPPETAPPFAVGTASAAPGQKAFGAIEVPAGVDPGTRIDVAVIRGRKPGPVLALVSGAHGTEYASIVAVAKLVQLLDPAAISGTVILVPLVNVPSFVQKVVHVNPIDGKSMNRFYPGKADGTQTERASLAITREVVDKCDHLIDLHGGDLDEDLRPYSYWTKTGNAAQDAISKEMVLAFGLDHVIVSTDRPKDPQASRYLENTATVRGKPSISRWYRFRSVTSKRHWTGWRSPTRTATGTFRGSIWSRGSTRSGPSRASRTSCAGWV